MICRLCLASRDECIEIFGIKGRKLGIWPVLSELFWFHIDENDAISTSICPECWHQTSTFHVFHNNIRIAQKQHESKCLEYLGNNTEDKQLIETLSYTLDVAVEKCKKAREDPAVRSLTINSDCDMECKAEPPETTETNQMIDAMLVGNSVDEMRTRKAASESESDNDYGPNDDGNCSDNSEPADMPKRRSIRTASKRDKADEDARNHSVLKSDNDDGSNDDDSDNSEPADMTKRRAIRKASKSVEADDDARIRSVLKSDIDDGSNDDDDDGNDNSNHSESADTPKRRTVRTASKRVKADEDARIRSVVKVFCDQCLQTFESFSDLTKHCRQQHNRRGFVMCCNRKLGSRGRVLDHIETHLNPNAFYCAACDSRFSGRGPYKVHMDMHLDEREKPFACADCPKRFTKAPLLERHRDSHHISEQEKRFVCDACDKKYTSAVRLAEHVKRSHEFVPEICDICGKGFKSIYNLRAHSSEVHNSDEVLRLQCTICGSWLREKYLKNHMKRHTSELQACTVCGKMLRNKNSLRNHMRNVHVDRLHECTVCGKKFNKPLALREHMALHTGQDLYTCTYCPRTFKSGANMYSHRKKCHFDEWTKDRDKRPVGVMESSS